MFGTVGGTQKLEFPGDTPGGLAAPWRASSRKWSVSNQFHKKNFGRLRPSAGSEIWSSPGTVNEALEGHDGLGAGSGPFLINFIRRSSVVLDSLRDRKIGVSLVQSARPWRALAGFGPEMVRFESFS